MARKKKIKLPGTTGVFIRPSQSKTFYPGILQGTEVNPIDLPEDDIRVQKKIAKKTKEIKKILNERSSGQRFKFEDRVPNRKFNIGGTFRGILGPSLDEDDPRVQEQIRKRTAALNLQREQQKIIAEGNKKMNTTGGYRIFDPNKASPLAKRMAEGGFLSSTALGAGRLAARAIPVVGTGLLAYEGAKALGFDPFAEEEIPQARPQAPIVDINREPGIRLSQTLRPTTQSTAKEVLNAAMLKYGLELMKDTRPGQTPVTQAIEAATSVGKEQNIYRTGAEALQAGKAAVGDDAKVSVYQRKDGTYGYQATTPTATKSALSSFLPDTTKTAQTLTKEQVDLYLRDNPNLTREQLVSALEQQGYTITGE